MSKAINCLIIDDEPLARELIRAFVLSKTDFVIVGESINPVAAYELLLNNDIDVIFLDIQMPVISGIDFLRSLKRPPKVIFTTAHARHAATAFDLNVVDYIVKPVTEERFEQALGKLQESFKHNGIGNAQASEASVTDYVFFKVDGKLIKAPFDDMVYFEALKDFTKVFLKDGKTVLLGEHLKAVEQLLPDHHFIRIHRSYTVAVKAVTGIFGNTVELGKVQLPVGASYREELFRVLNIK